MNTSLFIARRYLFSKKSVNAINIISGISMVGVLVGSASLVLILSVFNGLEDLILKMYGNFAPDLRIEATTGKSFDPRVLDSDAIREDERVSYYTEALQEKVLLRYGQNQFIGTLKGVSLASGKKKDMDSLLQEGHFIKTMDDGEHLVIGAAVQAYLGVNIEDGIREIEVYSPKRGVHSGLTPADEFNVRYMQPVGVMSVQPQMDDFVFSSLSFAKELLSVYDRISAIEIDLKKGVSIEGFKKELSEKIGADFVVKNRGEQNPTLYKILNSEKWAIFLILVFVLTIAILNIIGSLTMLVVDKKKDIAVLKSLGADDPFIKNIFFAEGMFISLLGCAVGMLLGLVLALVQQKFGIIKMQGVNLVTEVYPVSLRVSDFLLVFVSVVSIAALASFVSSRLSIKGDEKLS